MSMSVASLGQRQACTIVLKRVCTGILLNPARRDVITTILLAMWKRAIKKERFVVRLICWNLRFVKKAIGRQKSFARIPLFVIRTNVNQPCAGLGRTSVQALVKQLGCIIVPLADKLVTLLNTVYNVIQTTRLVSNAMKGISSVQIKVYFRDVNREYGKTSFPVVVPKIAALAEKHSAAFVPLAKI